jgi:hypothetical protein
MLRSINKASRTTADKYKKKLIENSDNNKYFLINQWQKQINNEEKNKIQYLLDIFNINIYNTHAIFPDDKYLISK